MVEEEVLYISEEDVSSSKAFVSKVSETLELSGSKQMIAILPLDHPRKQIQ